MQCFKVFQYPNLPVRFEGSNLYGWLWTRADFHAVCKRLMKTRSSYRCIKSCLPLISDKIAYEIRCKCIHPPSDVLYTITIINLCPALSLMTFGYCLGCSRMHVHLHAGELLVCWDKKRGDGRHPAVCIGTGKAEAALLKSTLSQVRAWSGGKHPLGSSPAALQTTEVSWVNHRHRLHVFHKFHLSL